MDDTVIGVSQLVKNYPNNPAVCTVSFKVRRGVALLGPNGAGKTTPIPRGTLIQAP